MNGKVCRYLRTSNHTSGQASFCCEAAERDLRLTPAQLRLAGCTPQRRRRCFRNAPPVAGHGDGDYLDVGFPGIEFAAKSWQGWHPPALRGPATVERLPQAKVVRPRVPAAVASFAGGMVAGMGTEQ